MKPVLRLAVLCGLMLCSAIAAAGPLIDVKLDLYSRYPRGDVLIGFGRIAVHEFPVGTDDPWFFDGPGQLKVFEFSSLPGASHIWHYALDDLYFQWGSFTVDVDGLVDQLAFQFGPASDRNEEWYVYGQRSPTGDNVLTGSWHVDVEHGTLLGRTIPEPGTLVLLLTGLGALSSTRRALKHF